MPQPGDFVAHHIQFRLAKRRNRDAAERQLGEHFLVEPGFKVFEVLLTNGRQHTPVRKDFLGSNGAQHVIYGQLNSRIGDLVDAVDEKNRSAAAREGHPSLHRVRVRAGKDCKCRHLRLAGPTRESDGGVESFQAGF